MKNPVMSLAANPGDDNVSEPEERPVGSVEIKAQRYRRMEIYRKHCQRRRQRK